MVHTKCSMAIGRSKPTHEFTHNGKKYIYCMGWIDARTDELDPICRECPDNYKHAQEDLEKLQRGEDIG